VRDRLEDDRICGAVDTANSATITLAQADHVGLPAQRRGRRMRANGAAANASALSSSAGRSRLGIPARAFDAARVTISLMSPSSTLAIGPSTTIVSDSDTERSLPSRIPPSILARADEVIE
jgi:hypothetical protein